MLEVEKAVGDDYFPGVTPPQPSQNTTSQADTKSVVAISLIAAIVSAAAALAGLSKWQWSIAVLVVTATVPWLTLWSRWSGWRWVMTAFISVFALSTLAFQIFIDDGGEPGNASDFIASPVNREQIGYCVSVRGIARQRSDSGLWLLIRGEDASADYWLGRKVDAAESKWDLPKVPVGEQTADVGKTFLLLLVSAEGGRSREWSERLSRGSMNLGKELPSDAQVEDRVVVTRTSATC